MCTEPILDIAAVETQSKYVEYIVDVVRFDSEQKPEYAGVGRLSERRSEKATDLVEKFKVTRAGITEKELAARTMDEDDADESRSKRKK